MREIRSYGSARGVRSNPYPYRDTLQPLRSSVFQPNPVPDPFRTQQSDSDPFGNLNLSIQEPPEPVYELWGRWQVIVLTARAQQHPIHKHVVGVTLFGLHDREQDHCLVHSEMYALRSRLSSRRQSQVGRFSSPPHDLFKRGPLASGRGRPIQGGISAFGQLWGYRWVVKKPGP
jgi:hypothetical protein